MVLLLLGFGVRCMKYIVGKLRDGSEGRFKVVYNDERSPYAITLRKGRYNITVKSGIRKGDGIEDDKLIPGLVNLYTEAEYKKRLWALYKLVRNIDVETLRYIGYETVVAPMRFKIGSESYKAAVKKFVNAYARWSKNGPSPVQKKV